MKKTYYTPEMETVELNLSGMLCVSGAEGGNSDGGADVSTGDPSDPDWGSDF